MRILTWNINGIRAQSSSVRDILRDLDSDVVCFQETKISRDMLDSSTAIVEGYTSYFSFCRTKSGYSGVATFCKDSALPIDASDSLQNPEIELGKIGRDVMLKEFKEEELQALDCEGRAVMTEHMISYDDNLKRLVVLNLYCPRVDPDKTERRTFQANYHRLVQIKAEALVETGRHVVIAGDMNVSHRKIDHCKPEENPDFEKRPDRLWLDHFLRDVHHPRHATCDNAQCRCGLPNSHRAKRDGTESDPKTQSDLPTAVRGEQEKSNHSDNIRMIDLFRYHWPSRKDAYTCWNTATGARQLNFGTRLDYTICDSGLPTQSCDISPEIKGSDHCPLHAELDVICVASDRTPATCTKFFKELAGKQCKLADFFKQDSKEPKSTDWVQASRSSITSENTSKSEACITDRKRPSDNDMKKKNSIAKKPKVAKSSSSGGRNLLTFFGNGNKKSGSQESVKSRNPNPEESLVPRATERVGDEVRSDLRVQTDTDYDIPTQSESQSAAVDPKAWLERFKQPPKPKCKGHNEACVLRTVKKDSFNKGRQFWVCAKPEGPKSDPKSRCDHFEWVVKASSKWKSSSQ